VFEGSTPSLLMLSSPSSSDTNTEYTIKLGLPPLGIVFEDIGNGYPPEGVQVVALISGGKGQACGKIEIGDVLKTCTAVKIDGAVPKLYDIDCTVLNFDTVVSAIGSNSPQFKCDSVEMTFIRPGGKE